MNRFFRVTLAVYEPTRLALDAVLGNPGPYAETCVRPVEQAPIDNQDRVYLAVLDTMFQWPQVQENVGELILSGLVQEITENEYRAAMPVGLTI